VSAEKYAILYGLTFDGRKRIKTKMRLVFTDLLTGNTILVSGLNVLADAVRKSRSGGLSKDAKTIGRERALELSEQFHGFKPRTIQQIKVEWPKSLVCLGPAARVDYISDKFDGTVRRYWHEFDDGSVLYTDPELQPDGSCMLIIIGKFTIEPEGITG